VVMALLFVVDIPEFRTLLKDTFPELRN